MKSSNFTSIAIALSGIVLGALAVLTFQDVFNQKKELRTQYQDWRKLNLILQKIDENYVDPVDRQKITDAAVVAALAELDPHSVYLPPEDLEEAETSLAGGFDGIGIQFNVPNDTAVVIEVIPGGPSEKVGLMPGDRLLKVDSLEIAGRKYPQDSMVRHMRGPAGTKVMVTVKRGSEVIPFEITRDKIPTHSVDAAFMVGDTTGYIRLSKFARTTFKEFNDASKDLRKQGMKELIFDLRDNSGGYLDQALQLANAFLEKGDTVVYIEGLHRKREDYLADGRGALKDMKLKVLINDGSASSSEIFAGAIQDNHRGLIYGRRSFGKGLVQEPVFFTDGSGIRLTVARFYTPSGRCIQKPYSKDYAWEVYKRYDEGEMVDADSMNVSKGGIIPDVFVPVDTTRASDFYIKCNRKATTMRFSSAYFDAHKSELGAISDYDELLKYLDRARLDKQFLAYAREKDGLVPKPGEWEESKSYMMTQIKALVGRYSKLGDNAFYHLYLQIDDVFAAARSSVIPSEAKESIGR
ncbi:MAG: S41 family peptidase [Bacteroidales bacterium]|nr:S41 family peptidase [Bacteroidales bacterium]